LIYANFGTREDYQTLVDAGIDFKGAIVIVKYGAILRGLKVSQAQELGAAGVIIYTDPEQDGEYQVSKGYEEYPYGPARQPSSIER
jgi:N-acetylated-alpha-linked acidic dipeptidase